MTLVSSVQAEDSTINSPQTKENTAKTPSKTPSKTLSKIPLKICQTIFCLKST